MEPMYDKMRRANELHKDEQKRIEKKLEARSKAKLVEIIEKKFTTTFIGDISAIEEVFGELWGHNKPSVHRTPREREWYEAWQILRSRILDRGNKQARAVVDELKQYTVSWQGYNMNLLSRKEQGNEG